jgi:hypothetical protein
LYLDWVGITLYRYGKLTDPGQTFWTPDPAYVRHCKGQAPNLQATLRDGARVKVAAGSARRRVIAHAVNRRNWDVLVFETWDWNTTEYVILNPDVLRISRRRARRMVAQR